MNTRTWIAIAALCGPLATTAALGQDRDEVLTLGDGPATGKRLTKEQLRQCLQIQPQLKTEGDEALQGRAELDQTKAEFDRIEAALQSSRATLNQSDKAAVDAYNAQIVKRRELLADYNAKMPAVNEQAQRYNALQQNWKSGCEDRPYNEADYAAIPRR